MNNDFTSTYEYTVEQKPEGKFKLMKIGFMALYILYPVIFMAILFIIQLFHWAPPHSSLTLGSTTAYIRSARSTPSTLNRARNIL